MILDVLRHEAAALPRARDEAISIESALPPMSAPHEDIRNLLDAMRPDTEFGQAMFLAPRDIYPNLFRVAQPERWLHGSGGAPKRIVHLVDIVANGLRPGGAVPGSSVETCFSRFRRVANATAAR